jgi:hypothetical protein
VLYWLTSIKIVKFRLKEIKVVLEISTDEGDKSTRSTSRGLVWKNIRP